MSYRATVDFLLHDWLDVGALRSRERIADLGAHRAVERSKLDADCTRTHHN